MAKLKFYYSSMNAGKSTALLQFNHTLISNGYKTLIMKPAIDTRTDGTISSRLGIEKECLTLSKRSKPSAKIKAEKHKPDFVLVDEAQFLTPDQVWDLSDIVDLWDINVVCYGLKIDWEANLFPGSRELFVLADELESIVNVSRKNSETPAFFHIKNGGSKKSVEVGDMDMYSSVGRSEWKEWRDK